MKIAPKPIPPEGLQKPQKDDKPRRQMRRVAKGQKSSSDCDFMRSARGEACLADWCGCGGSTETTVMCHVRKFGVAGMGKKPPNWMGFYGCEKAHRMFDQRAQEWSWEGLMQAVLLTQMKLHRKGLLP